MRKGLTRRRLLAASAAAGVAPAAALAKSPDRGGGGTSAALPIPVITSPLSDTATQGVAYSYSITATNSPTSYGASGLPTGLSLTGNVISGTPTGTGTSSIGLSATNASGTGTATLSLNVMAPGALTTFVTSFTLGAAAGTGPDVGDTGIHVGMAITVGPTTLTLTQVGRYMTAGDTHTHNIIILVRDTSNSPTANVNNLTVPGGSATINMTGGTPGTFVYATLQSPTVLAAGGTYYIMSTETLPSGGSNDALYVFSPVVTTTDATIIGACDVDGSYPDVFVTASTAGQTHGPLNFKYTVGTTLPTAIIGSPYPAGAFNSFRTTSATAGPINGPIVLQGIYSNAPGGTLTYQWMISSGTTMVPLSPVLTWSDWAASRWLDWTFDTTTKANGTYVVYPQALDWTNGKISDLGGWGHSIIIWNGTLPASSAAGQLVPMAPYSVHGENPRPDFLTFDGTPNPSHTTYPISYTFIDPASGPGGLHSASLRDPTNWWGEVQPGPRNIEYYGAPQWCTTITGGVHVQYNNPLDNVITSPETYDKTVLTNTMDGTRLNALVSPFSNFVENPDISGEFWGAELGGRIFKITRTGQTITIYGPRRDKNVLTLAFDYLDNRTAPDDVEAIQSHVGTWPPPADMDGANDICFDPRNHNILYIACQLEHWIAALNISAGTVSIYAGIPGTATYVDNANPLLATFNQPSSLIMDSAGTMYICDRENFAIRKIVSSGTVGVAGAVTTLVGGTLSPTFPVPSPTTMTALGASYPVTSFTWNSSTHTGTLTLTSAPAPTFALGQHLGLQGSTNSAGPNVNWSELVDGRYINKFVVTAVASSTSYSLKWFEFDQEPAIGTLTGTMTMSVFNQDLYSPPGTVTGVNNMYVCLANWIRFASPGPSPGQKIVFGETINSAVRLLDLSGTPTLRRIGLFDAFLDQDPGGSWYWGDVDYAGTCGPIDDVFMWKGQDHRTAAHQTWRTSLAVGAIPGQPAYQGVAFTDSNQYGLPSNGPMPALQGGEGHYPWAVALSRVEGRLISGGVADWHCVMMRIKQSSDPNIDVNADLNFHKGTWNAGESIHVSGTAPGFPWGSRPGFEALYGRYGGTFVLNGAINTFEDLFFKTDAEIATFIQSGMGGAVPRPEITGAALDAYIYFVRRCAMQGNIGTPVSPATAQSDRTPPVFMAISASRSGTTVTVTCTTGKNTLGFAGAGSATQAITYGYFPMWSAIESVYATSHIHTITVPAAISPAYVTAVAKDLAGNIVHSATLTV